jgi:hypothetical protein
LSEYDELRELAAENPELAERLYERLGRRIKIPDSLDEFAYAYIFEQYNPMD